MKENKNVNKSEGKFATELFFWAQALVLSLVILVLFNVFFFRVSGVVGSSMEPTLQNGDRVFLRIIGYTEPQRGDIVVLLVVAKNDHAHRALSAQLEDHSLYREYRALVQGGFKDDAGTVDAPIGRHPVDRKRMAVLRGDPHAKHAVTHYTVLARYGRVSELSLRLETGRTHQIRVHMSSLGHPLLGDTVYGGGGTQFEKKHAALLSGQALHAERISFIHPTSGERVSFSCPLPEDFEKLRTLLQKEALSD